MTFTLKSNQRNRSIRYISVAGLQNGTYLAVCGDWYVHRRALNHIFNGTRSDIDEASLRTAHMNISSNNLHDRITILPTIRENPVLFPLSVNSATTHVYQRPFLYPFFLFVTTVPDF
jgi:23S rRNA A1618 N6-methylase RlmF